MGNQVYFINSDKNTRKIYEIVLNDAGFDVETFSNIDEASVIQINKPLVVVHPLISYFDEEKEFLYLGLKLKVNSGLANLRQVIFSCYDLKEEIPKVRYLEDYKTIGELKKSIERDGDALVVKNKSDTDNTLVKTINALFKELNKKN